MPLSLAEDTEIGDATETGADMPHKVMVESKSSPTGFTCYAGETLLYEGLRQGLSLPYECATGTCGSCRARVMSGEVEVAWEEAPGAARLKRDKGDILLCQSRAASDLRLRIPAVVEAGLTRHRQPDHRTGVIGERRLLTPDVMHFEIALSGPMAFDAGQFAVIRAPGLAGGRAYSMVNYATEARRIEFVVKRKPGGSFGDWLFDFDRQGQVVDVFGPLGRATFHPEDEKNLLMIAGGSGVAGMMSILARATESDYFSNHKGYIFFGVRTLEDGFYLDELGKYAEAAFGNLEVTLATSDDQPASEVHPAHPQIRLASGFVHEVMARAMAGRYDDAMGYIAGPPKMVEGALRVLIQDGQLPPETIRYDKFG